MMTAGIASTFSIFARGHRDRLAGIGAAAAQPMPDAENGRYALSPVTDGVIRLDTRTGEVRPAATTALAGPAMPCPTNARRSMRKSAGCRPTMKSSRRNWRSASRPSPARSTNRCRKSDSLKQPEPKVAEGSARSRSKIEIPLPSDRDMDRVMSFLEQAWRRLVEMANRVQKDVNGKI